MSSDWKEVSLDDIADLNGGYAFKSEEYTEVGHFVLRTVNISDDGRICQDGAAYVSPASAKKYERFQLKDLDTLFVMVGATLGKTGLVKAGDLPALLNQNMWVVRAKTDQVDPLFLHYAFKVISRPMCSLASGSARGFVKRDDFRQMRVRVPEIRVQRRISDLLGALDDRITLLRETNTTLEAIAQALFKSWFVDFDPVHAKMQGRAPEGMDEATAALFPDSFEESELGDVPKGWKPIRLDSFIELAYGKALKSDTRRPGAVPVYGSGGITGWHDTALVSEASIVVGRKGTVGSIYWENRPFFPIDTVFYVKASKPLAYCHLLLMKLGLEDMNTDAAVPGLNRENVYRLQVPDAQPAVVKAFDDFVSALRRSIDRNNDQAKTLSDARDTLLARLISGQLRLPETQAIFESV